MVRLDKYLWMVRLCKTRSKAADLIAKGSVKLNGEICKKASKTVNVQDSIYLRYTPIWKTYKVLDFPKSRVGAKLVPDYMEETTKAEDLELLKEVQRENRMAKIANPTGRPTKKNRRDLDDFFNA